MTMRGDFSRLTFRPENHFSGVLLQQGRVQLDAEFNEQVAIDVYRDRATARDVIGPAGAPIDGGGFAIAVASMLRGVGTGDDMWAVGENGTVMRSAGRTGQWSIERVPAETGRLNAVHVVQASGWAVGDGATILRLAGTSWTSEALASEVTVDLHGVYAAANGAWAVGAAGTVLSWSGTAWERQARDAGVTTTLRDVHFAGDNGIAVGDDGTVLATANRGAKWTAQTTPEGAGDLYGVFLVDAQHAWAVGTQGTVLFFNGTEWTYQTVSPRVPTTLRAVMFTSSIEGTAVGDGGIALAFADGVWEREWTGIDVDLHAIAALPGGAVLAAGNNVTLTRSQPGESWQPGPAMPTDDDGGARGKTLTISAGDIYVEGVRCENERTVSLDHQPEPLLNPAGFPPATPGTYGVFLHVQEQHLTATEREELREVALGGPDSATRARTVWQASLVGLSTADASCADVVARSPADPARGLLRARAVPAAVATSECIVPPTGGYRRLENQLYRVEIHDGTPAPVEGEDGTGAGAATYTWSRDNGSTIARLEGLTPDAANKAVDAKVSYTGRDATIGFGPEQIVELTDEGRLLRAEPGVLVEIKELRGSTLVLSNPNSWSLGLDDFLLLSMDDFPVNPIVRRWDGIGTVEFGNWKELEDGVFIEFAEGPDRDDAFRTGDYWTIPARTLSGRVEWPQTDGIPRFEERHGPRRNTAPLAIASIDAEGIWSSVRDCRRRFPPLTDLVHLYYVGGDGQEATPPVPLARDNLVPLDRPLEVGVVNGGTPMAGAIVEFEIFSAEGEAGAGSGKVTAPGGTLANKVVIVTDELGIARCQWQLDGETRTQVVEARFRDPLDQSPPQVVRFNAQLSAAPWVAYSPPQKCSEMADAATVQAAIDRLASLLPRLYHVSGDGLEAPVGATVTLRAGIANRCGIDDPRIRFEHLGTERGPRGTWDELTTVPADDEGIASCSYEVTDQARQLLRAVLLALGKPVGQPVYFTVSPAEANTAGLVPAARIEIVDGAQQALDQQRTLVEFRTQARFDTDHLYNPGTDRTALRATRSGSYIATAEVTWNNAGDSGSRIAEIMLNNERVGQVVGPGLPEGVDTTQQVTAIVSMQLGDRVQLWVTQHSDVTQLILSATLSLAWLGPSKPGNRPVVTIDRPGDDSTFDVNSPVTFVATATDAQGNSLTGDAVRWFDSHGTVTRAPLGHGTSLTTMLSWDAEDRPARATLHTIVVEAADNHGNTASDLIRVFVGVPSPPTLRIEEVEVLTATQGHIALPNPTVPVRVEASSAPMGFRIQFSRGVTQESVTCYNSSTPEQASLWVSRSGVDVPEPVAGLVAWEGEQVLEWRILNEESLAAGRYEIVAYGDGDAASGRPAIVSTDNQRLDGEPATLPSGDATEGGNFSFTIDVTQPLQIDGAELLLEGFDPIPLDDPSIAIAADVNLGPRGFRLVFSRDVAPGSLTCHDDQFVSPQQASLSVVRADTGGASVAGVIEWEGAKTAVWRPSNGGVLDPGVYEIVVYGDADDAEGRPAVSALGTGERLDGEPDALPSGDGAEGGDFTFSIELGQIN
jgi:photosystem II stability/assembly factor-like uncharacterized protein